MYYTVVVHRVSGRESTQGFGQVSYLSLTKQYCMSHPPSRRSIVHHSAGAVPMQSNTQLFCYYFPVQVYKYYPKVLFNRIGLTKFWIFEVRIFKILLYSTWMGTALKFTSMAKQLLIENILFEEHGILFIFNSVVHYARICSRMDSRLINLDMLSLPESCSCIYVFGIITPRRIETFTCKLLTSCTYSTKTYQKLSYKGAIIYYEYNRLPKHITYNNKHLNLHYGCKTTVSIPKQNYWINEHIFRTH